MEGAASAGACGRAVQSPPAPTHFAQLSHRPLGNRSGDFRSRLENAPEDLRVSHTCRKPCQARAFAESWSPGHREFVYRSTTLQTHGFPLTPGTALPRALWVPPRKGLLGVNLACLVGCPPRAAPNQLHRVSAPEHPPQGASGLPLDFCESNCGTEVTPRRLFLEFSPPTLRSPDCPRATDRGVRH